MKRIFLILSFLIFCPSWVWGATYYIGSSNASGVSDDYGNISQMRTAEGNESAGDFISFRSGATHTTWAAVASGSAGSPITYTSHGTGAKPIFDGAGTVSYAIEVNNKDHIVLDSLATAQSTSRGCYVRGTSSGITILNLVHNGGGVYGVQVYQSSDIYIDGLTCSPGTSAPIVLYDITNLTAYDLEASDGTNNILFRDVKGTWTVERVTADNSSSHAIEYGYDTGSSDIFYLTGVTITNSGAQGIYVGNGNNVSGLTFYFSGISIYSCTSSSLYVTGLKGIWGYIKDFTVSRSDAAEISLENLTETNDFYIEDFDLNDSVAGRGIQLTDVSGVTIRDGTVTNMDYDGVSLLSGCSYVWFQRVVSRENGIGGTAIEGDGFTCHDDSSPIVFEHCLAYDNGNAGFAHTGNSGGSIFNCTIYNNGGDNTTKRGGYWTNSGETWWLRNNIFKDNLHEIVETATGKGNTDSDYNCLDHTGASGFFRESEDGAVSIATYTGVSGYESNSQTSDPLFDNSGASIFTLQNGTPCKRSGDASVIDSGQRDLSGRNYAGKPTIGAYWFWDQKFIRSKRARNGRYSP